MMRSVVALLLLCAAVVARGDDAARGQEVYDSVCRVCHGSGVAGSPRFGDRAAWAPRLEKGLPAVFATALSGKGAMPPKGGRLDLPDADIRAAVIFMVRQAVGELPPGLTGDPAPTRAAPPSTPAPAKSPRTTGPASATAPGASEAGAKTFRTTCSICHGPGLAGAPRYGDAAAWRARAQAGVESLYRSALQGKRAMPARGGNAQLTDAEVRSAVDYMLQKVGIGGTGNARARPAGSAAPGAAPAAASGAATGPTVAAAATAGSGTPAPAAGDSAPVATTVTAPTTPTTPGAGATANPNAFNRLLRSVESRHRPPSSDGIHDPENDGTPLLQAPEQALAQLPKRNAVGDVDWVKAAADGAITPRADLTDPAAQMFVLDLNIVREVKGTMPDVVYPHAAHTRWLDCSNCHPAIFIPQKGANQISMAAIMLGQKCGVCHGTIAFPVSECRRCHSKPKPVQAGANP